MTPENSPTRLVVPVQEDETEQAVEPVDEAEVLDVSDDAPPQTAKPRSRTRRHLLRQLIGRAGAGVWLGLLLTAIGFGLIAFTWSKTAALIDVSQQVPYLVSGGLVGLGLILVGLLVVNISVKRREAQERSRQLEEVRDALVGLRSSIEGLDEDQPT